MVNSLQENCGYRWVGGGADTLKEIQLHELLIANPNLIEDGCIFVESEVNLQGKRCDLLFHDKEGKKLYIEVKLKVDDKAVGQLLRYDGLVNNPEARFMLAGLSFVGGLKEGLEKHGYEYKEILLDNVEKINITEKTKKIPIRKSRYETVEELIESFSRKEQQIAREIFDYAIGLDEAYYYLSDGIMFRRAKRRYKFLSISTIGNRVLFHVPVKMRNTFFEQFKEKIKIYIPVDSSDKNQIDIDLKDIDSLDSIKDLINLAYEKRE